MNSDEDTQVTLTATASYGLLTAEAKYTVTVKALDLTLLKAVVAEAKEMQADVFEADSYQALQNACLLYTSTRRELSGWQIALW